MSTTVALADWIQRIADDERKRDETRARTDEVAAHKAALIRSNGQRMIDEIRAAVTRDVEAFRDEFVGDPARDVVVEATALNGGFVARKPAPAAVTLIVTPNLDTAVMSCHYRFELASGFPPREDRIDLLFASDGRDTLQIKHHGSGQAFATVDAISEFLLVPVLTGRPR